MPTPKKPAMVKKTVLKVPKGGPTAKKPIGVWERYADKKKPTAKPRATHRAQ